MSINKKIHTKIINEIIRLNTNSYDHWEVKQRKSSEDHAHYIMIETVNNLQQTKNSPPIVINGRINSFFLNR